MEEEDFDSDIEQAKEEVLRLEEDLAEEFFFLLMSLVHTSTFLKFPQLVIPYPDTRAGRCSLRRNLKIAFPGRQIFLCRSDSTIIWLHEQAGQFVRWPNDWQVRTTHIHKYMG